MKGEIGSNGRHRVRAGERSAPFVVALIGQRELTGFSLGKIDLILDEAAEKKAEVSAPEDDVRRTACEAVVSAKRRRFRSAIRAPSPTSTPNRRPQKLD